MNLYMFNSFSSLANTVLLLMGNVLSFNFFNAGFANCLVKEIRVSDGIDFVRVQI